MQSLDVYAPVLLSDPINRHHAHCRDLMGAWLTVPGPDGGRQWFDLMGLNHGTLNSGPTWLKEGPPGSYGGLGFTTAGGTYVKVNSSPSLNSWSTITISCWLRVDSTGQLQYGRIWEKGVNTEIAFIISHDSANDTHVTVQQLGTGNALVQSTFALTVGTWYHTAVTVDGSRVVSLYLNGVLNGSATSSTGPASTNGDLYFSRYGGAGYYLNGSLDGAFYWRRCLSADEVWQHYNLARTGYPGFLNRLDLDWIAGWSLVAVSSSDSGTGAEADTLLALLSAVTDTGTGTDSAAIAGSLSASDSGTGSEADTLLALIAVVTDTGTGTEAASLAASLAGSDTGTGTDSAAIAAALGDSDAGSGVDSQSLAASLSVSDSGTGTETVALLASLTDSDSGTGVESATLNSTVFVTAGDSGTGTEAASLAASLAGSDTAAGVETASLAALLSAADAGTAAESFALLGLLVVADTGMGTEGTSLVVFAGLPSRTAFASVGRRLGPDPFRSPGQQV
jgi:hypothetical protein